jgi:hypothetical protein
MAALAPGWGLSRVGRRPRDWLPLSHKPRTEPPPAHIWRSSARRDRDRRSIALRRPSPRDLRATPNGHAIAKAAPPRGQVESAPLTLRGPHRCTPDPASAEARPPRRGRPHRCLAEAATEGRADKGLRRVGTPAQARTPGDPVCSVRRPCGIERRFPFQGEPFAVVRAAKRT